MPSRRRRAIVALPFYGSKWRIEPWAWDGRAGLIFMPMARHKAARANSTDLFGRSHDCRRSRWAGRFRSTHIHSPTLRRLSQCSRLRTRVHCRYRRNKRAEPQNSALPRRPRSRRGSGSLQFHLATPLAINSLPRRWLQSVTRTLARLRGLIEGLFKMDFTLSPEIEDLRQRTRAFIEQNVLPLEDDPQNFSEHENIPLARLAPVQEKARKAGLWAPPSTKRRRARYSARCRSTAPRRMTAI